MAALVHPGWRPDQSRISLGVRGEKLYGFRNFTELYSVFSTPKILTVLWGTQEIGSMDAQFAEQEQTARLTFTLGARTWRALDIDWKNAIVRVEPSNGGASARWQGGAKPLQPRDLRSDARRHGPRCRGPVME